MNLSVIDTFGGAKSHLLWQGQKHRLSINPEKVRAFKPGCVEWVDLGNISFQGAFLKQIQTQQEVRLGIQPNRLFLCEHPHTITFSRQARVDNIVDKTLVKDKEIDFVMGVNRGGDITYHGPGQLVGYLIFNLREFGRDLGWFLDRIDELLIRILVKFNIEGQARKGFRGVWVGGDKIASIGIGVDRWVSMHGFALNVNTDLSFFDKIKPCGLDCRMTSMQKCLGKKVDMEFVKRVVKDQTHKCFELKETKACVSLGCSLQEVK